MQAPRPSAPAASAPPPSRGRARCAASLGSRPVSGPNTSVAEGRVALSVSGSHAGVAPVAEIKATLVASGRSKSADAAQTLLSPFAGRLVTATSDWLGAAGAAGTRVASAYARLL